MSVNRHPARCIKCSNIVPANGGRLIKRPHGWFAIHPACEEGGSVIAVTFNDGKTITRNSRGICEDAPCCGCCTF